MKVIVEKSEEIVEKCDFSLAWPGGFGTICDMEPPGYNQQALAKGYPSYRHWWNASPEADLLKRRVRAKHPGVCWCCGGFERLQLHHIRYSILGEEPHTDFKVLCDECHQVVTKIIKSAIASQEHAHELRRAQVRQSARRAKRAA